MAVDPYINNIGIQIKRKELTKTCLWEFQIEQHFGFHGLYKNILAL